MAFPDGNVVEMGQIVNTPSAVGSLVDRLSGRHKKLSFAYEAGPCGYGLYRQLQSLKQSCIVVAPSLIPRRPGDRIKTDRRDAITLARLLRSGDLTAVWVPDEHHEAIRDLVRCREDFKQAERRCRQRMCGMLLRQGRMYSGSTWTQQHRRWLLGQKFDRQELRTVFEHYLHAIVEAEEGRQKKRQREECYPIHRPQLNQPSRHAPSRDRPSAAPGTGRIPVPDCGGRNPPPLTLDT